MKGHRLLSAMLLLQAHGRLTARELAERLEVSQRTVHRDMDALSAAGVPVHALRGSQGGWRLDENWRTSVPGLDDEELRSLLMSRFDGDAGEQVLTKLLAALPKPVRERAAAIRQRLYVDPAGWHGAPTSLAAFPAVQTALARDRKLAIDYRDPGGELARRIVDPLGLVAKGPAWYLFAATPRGYRTYRIGRIAAAEVLDEPSHRPPRFDLAAAWKASVREFASNRKPYVTTLRLAPRAAEQMRQWPGTEQNGNTWRVEFDSEDSALFVVLGFGTAVDVVAPIELRARLREEVTALTLRLAGL